MESTIFIRDTHTDLAEVDVCFNALGDALAIDEAVA
jgi:hypothetical protein